MAFKELSITMRKSGSLGYSYLPTLNLENLQQKKKDADEATAKYCCCIMTRVFTVIGQGRTEEVGETSCSAELYFSFLSAHLNSLEPQF